MINVTEEIYRSLAENLINEVEELNGDFYNGCVELDGEDYFSELKCSLILFRSETPTDCGPDQGPCAGCTPAPSGCINKIVPVWWEFALYTCQGAQLSNFSWKEFATYLKPYTLC